MIEIELKLEVNEFPDFSALKKLSEKDVLDIYYDTPDYKLIQGGNFLRNRNNSKVDFKLNLDDLTHTYCKETRFDLAGFHHSTDLENVFKTLNIDYNPNFSNFEEFLKANNLETLATIDKHRIEYELDDLKISIDDAKNIGKFIEIEKCLPDGEKFDKDEVTKYMIDKLTRLGLLTNYKLVKIGYVELFLKLHNQQAYNLGLYKE